MKPVSELRVDLVGRTVYVRMHGIFNEEDMKEWSKHYREKATKAFRGIKHMVIADMRGMRPSALHVAKIMGDEIGYARLHGVVLCAHMSDHTVLRLQAARVARQNSPDDDVTVDVTSLEEAHAVIEEGRARLDDRRYAGSIREAVRAP
jgi:hypothetical protein